jgi:antitoxin (DNA-binding transcriptional repressor) of toxin-antitoxin stability system
MERISVADAERSFSVLLNRVRAEGISIELAEGDKVVAHLSPAVPRPSLRVHDLNAFLRSLPKLGDDAESFGHDLRSIRREFPAETNPWD